MIPKVSICIPAYLQVQFLKQTIDSVLSQDFDDYEIVITDDSPNESVKDLIKTYRNEARLKYFRNEKPLGSPENWNQSVRLSKGEYIKILHHDDWLAGPSSLSEFVKLLDANPDAGFAFSGAIAQVPDSRKSWHHFATKSQISRLKTEPTSLFLQNIIGPPSSTIIRRSAFLDYDNNLVWLVDIAQYIEVLCKTNCVATKAPLIYSTTQAPHQITESVSQNKKLNLFEYFYVFNKTKEFIPQAKYHSYVEKLTELIYWYNVQSVEEIRMAGYNGPVPERISSAVKSSETVKTCQRLKILVLRLLSSVKRKLSRLE